MLVPLVLLMIFIPVVYALGCSVKGTIHVQRNVPVPVARLHRLIKKRQKMVEFHPHIETEMEAESGENEEKTLVVFVVPLGAFKKRFELMKAARYIDLLESESVDIAMDPIGLFELFFHYEQEFTYERVSESESILHDKVTVVVPRIFLSYITNLITDAENQVCNKVVEYFDERNQLRMQKVGSASSNLSLPSSMASMQ